MIDDNNTSARVKEQMDRGVFSNGVWYRRDESGKLAPWPVLKLDRLAREAMRSDHQGVRTVT